MNLLTKATRQQMPRLYATEDIPAADKVVQVKYFTPWSNWTWYAVEADAIDNNGNSHPLSYIDDLAQKVVSGQLTPFLGVMGLQDVIFFGLVEGFEREWGQFSLKELQSIRGPFGLTIERDMYMGRPTMRQARPDLFPTEKRHE